MTRIEIMQLGEADIRSLAEIAFRWLQSTSFQKETRTIEKVKSTLNEAAKDSDNSIIVASYHEDNRISGWLGMYLGFPKMAFIDSWHPYIEPETNVDKVVYALIEGAKTHISKIGKERLEVEFTYTESHSKMLKQYTTWYEDARFIQAAEEIGMSVNLQNIEIEKIPLPTGYTLVSIRDMSNEQLRRPFFEAFNESNDDLFLSMTREQQKVTFDYWFNRTRPMNEQASYAVSFDGVCIGFIVTRAVDEEVYIGPIGVIPSHRGKRVGNSILSNCLYELKRQNIRTVTLDVSSSNESALKLYRRFGFVEIKKQLFYYWNSGQ
jgi:ribosomal protein S18 acetylase RimI-like enzyme